MLTTKTADDVQFMLRVSNFSHTAIAFFADVDLATVNAIAKSMGKKTAKIKPAKKQRPYTPTPQMITAACRRLREKREFDRVTDCSEF